jgi:hypothetical protein
MTSGQAKPMLFAFIHHSNGLTPTLQLLLPSASWHAWKNPRKKSEPKLRASQTRQVRDGLRLALKQLLAEGKKKISTKALRRRAGLSDEVSKNVLSNAIKLLAKEGQWTRQGQSVEYMW